MENIFLEIPKVCPYCGKPTEIKKENDSEVLYCVNQNCEGRSINRLNYFCGKKGLDIKGLSKATLEKFISWGWVDSPLDLYTLAARHGSDLNKKPGFGVASATKILNAIEESKNAELGSFISAMGIPLIGQVAAVDLANEFKTYENFRAAVDDKEYYFFNIPNFGLEMNYSIKNFNYTEMDKLSKILTIKPVLVNKNLINNTLEGKTIVITGKINNFKNRDELKKVIQEHGGKVVGSISNKTDMLINNDINSDSTKNKTAKAKGVMIISEEDFIHNYLEN